VVPAVEAFNTDQIEHDGPADAAKGIRGSAAAEAGSFGFVRTAAALDAASDDVSVAAGLGWQRATGIDSFDGSGDRDGYRNLAARVRAAWTLLPALTLGASGFALNGRSEFDGFDPVTFLRADTLDLTRNRITPLEMSRVITVLPGCKVTF